MDGSVYMVLFLFICVRVRERFNESCSRKCVCSTRSKYRFVNGLTCHSVYCVYTARSTTMSVFVVCFIYVTVCRM